MFIAIQMPAIVRTSLPISRLRNNEPKGLLTDGHDGPGCHDWTRQYLFELIRLSLRKGAARRDDPGPRRATQGQLDAHFWSAALLTHSSTTKQSGVARILELRSSF
jgi:hypothetical protein